MGSGVANATNFYRRFVLSDPIHLLPLDKNGKVENMRFIGTGGEHADFPEGAGVELFFVYDSCSKQGPASATTTP